MFILSSLGTSRVFAGDGILPTKTHGVPTTSNDSFGLTSGRPRKNWAKRVKFNVIIYGMQIKTIGNPRSISQGN
jgi:hypothetical protein